MSIRPPKEKNEIELPRPIGPERIEDTEATYKTELADCLGVNRERPSVFFVGEKALDVMDVGNVGEMLRSTRYRYDLVKLRQKAVSHQLLNKAGIAGRKLLASIVANQVRKNKSALAFRVCVGDLAA